MRVLEHCPLLKLFVPSMMTWGRRKKIIRCTEFLIAARRHRVNGIHPRGQPQFPIRFMMHKVAFLRWNCGLAVVEDDGCLSWLDSGPQSVSVDGTGGQVGALEWAFVRHLHKNPDFSHNKHSVSDDPWVIARNIHWAMPLG